MREVLPSDPRTTFFEAQTAYREGDFARARTLARTLVGFFPDNAGMQQFAGLVELRLDAPLLAEPPLTKALLLAPGAADTRRHRAVVYLKTAQPARLQDVLEPLLARGDAQALRLLASLDLDERHPEAARARLAALLKKEPANPAVLVALADVLERSGETLDTLARALRADKQTDKALVAARKALALAPGSALLNQHLDKVEAAAAVRARAPH